MSKVIAVDAISKTYRLGAIGGATLKEDVSRWWAKRRGKADPLLKIGKEHQARLNGDEFWALRDVSFEVEEGEVLGIIGRNGAGKSTLLKILSQVTAPTSGQIKIKGRIASLLEVGTGFHPELTGRENILLNGAILGMNKAEIRRKLDEIIDFSGIAEFIDSPVKRYSSGMYVRLAFAVAAHLEPEILIVDEVLAVGDTEFQKKCLGKMEDVAQHGRTVLFVSHNMATVTTLCSKALVLKDGEVDFPLGDVSAAVRHYLSQVAKLSTVSLRNRSDRQGDGMIRLVDFEVFDSDAKPCEFFLTGQEVEFRIYYECTNSEGSRNVHFAIGIYGAASGFVTMLSNEIASGSFERIDHRGFVSCRLAKLPLTPGDYTINLAVREKDTMQDWVQEAAILKVESGDFYGTGKLAPPSHGGVLVEQQWAIA